MTEQVHELGVEHVHELGVDQVHKHVGLEQEHVGQEGFVHVGLLGVIGNQGEGLHGVEVVHGWGIHDSTGHKGVSGVHHVQVLHS